VFMMRRSALDPAENLRKKGDFSPIPTGFGPLEGALT
jgi:hypothetical protein